MSLYNNKSIYIFMESSYSTLQKSLPIKNLWKAINFFMQICKAIEYLHSKNIVYGIINPHHIYIDKTRIILGTRNLYDINKDGATKNFI